MATKTGKIATAKVGANPPKNISIKHTSTNSSGFVFTVEWKLGEKNYTAQEARYKLATSETTWRKFGSSYSVGKDTTSKTFTVPYASAHPYGNLGSLILVEIRAKNKSDGWSEWVAGAKEYAPKAPQNISTGHHINLTVENTSETTATFNWTYDINDSDEYVFNAFEWQTCLVEDCNYEFAYLAPFGQSTFQLYTSGTSQTGTRAIPESSSTLNNGHSHTRWFRVRACGLGGDSPWTYAYRTYITAPKGATNVSTTAKTDGLHTTIITEFDTASSMAYPIEGVKRQYTLATPDTNLACPSGASWTDDRAASYGNGKDKLISTIDAVPSLDQCMYVRIGTLYDNVYTWSDAELVSVGKIKTPTMQAPVTDASTHKATITATNNSDIPDSQIAVVYQGTNHPDKSFIIGIIPDGYTSVTVQAPNWDDEDAVAFGTFAFVGTPTKQTREDGVDVYTITSPNSKFEMRSTTVWLGGTVPKAPSNVSVKVKDGAEGIVTVNWDWTWEDATGAELAWADHEDAWESTDEPDTFSVSNLHAAHWNIAGLDAGKTWYIRIRFFQETESSTVYSPWSELTSSSIIDLSSAPDEPAIELSAGVVPYDGAFTVNWGYVSTDGTPQARASVCEVTQSGGANVYTEIGHTLTAQHIDFSVAQLGWQNGTTHYVALKVWSESGNESEWSAPMPVIIAPRLTCSITSTSLETVTVPADDDEETTRQVLSLTEMPLSVSVSGAGASGITTVAVERAESYFAERPDEVNYGGYEGETVALKSINGAGTISFALADMIGKFDDGASYRIVATVEDGNGQKATATQQFEVHWDHQAIVPEAFISIIPVEGQADVAAIIPIAPEGAISSDRADIYRLTVDKPQLVVEGAEFGTAYVDPYPTIGVHGGHRIVFVTANGDYITEDNQFAWVDLAECDGDILESEQTIIDFGGRQIQLAYNLDVNNKWSKDFEETRYLGGSIQGDWNPGVSRSGSISTVAITLTDADMIRAMRQLADYTGLCKVRTQDGSNFVADIQVQEKRGYKTGGKVVDFDLSFTSVDPVGLDGLTFDEWYSPREEPEPYVPPWEYEGDYTITPLPEQDVIVPTKDKRLLDNITVLGYEAFTVEDPEDDGNLIVYTTHVADDGDGNITIGD